MKTTKLLLALGLALGTTAAFAQTTPATPATPAAAPAATATAAARPMHKHHRRHRHHKVAAKKAATDSKADASKTS